ncbi:DUF6207 family protein [Streptomyces harbinensis]|uniref:DUF6207 family protein n=1 Tax=Streptomyces harbinensis TaxID=1176198 RepID=UPI0034DF1DC1
MVGVAAADDATALAFQQLLADRWATANSGHDPGRGRARPSAALLPGPASAPFPDLLGLEPTHLAGQRPEQGTRGAPWALLRRLTA